MSKDNESCLNLKSMFTIHMSNIIFFEKCFCSYRLGNENTETTSKILPLGPHQRGGKTRHPYVVT